MKKYEQYKDSGIQWIGQIPDNWEVKKLKYLGEAVIGITYSPDEVTSQGSGILVLRSSNIQGGKLSLEDSVFVDKQVEKKHLTLSGDILLCARNGSPDLVGKNILIDAETQGMTFGAFMTIFRSEYSDFVYWFFNSNIFKAQSGSFSTSTINQLTSDVLNNMKVSIPHSKSERIAISDFLTQKCNAISQAIQKKQVLINALLEEKSAVIKHAVTKGIDETVPMKPSGIEWLGDIPTHWNVSKIGYLTKVVRGASPRPAGDPKYFNGDHTPWITVAEVTKDNEKFLTAVTDYLTEEGASQSRFVEVGTLLLSNSGATLGVPKILKIGGCINDGSVAFLNLSKKVHIDFLFYYFCSLTFVYRDMMKGYGQPNLNTDIVKSTPIAIPGIEEQIKVVFYIENELQKVTTLISKIEREIELLTEYKSSLIYEVVTGKVKVPTVIEEPSEAELAS